MRASCHERHRAGYACPWQDVRNNDGSVVAEAARERDPYELAIDEPGFLEAVGAVYRGRLAPLDALWWFSHPDDPTPDGRPAPSAVLRALQRRAFAADGDAAGDSAVARAILAAEEGLAAERTAIGAAVAVVRARRAATPGAGSAFAEPAAEPAADRTADRAPEPDAAEPAPEAEPEPVPVGTDPARMTRRRIILAAGLAAAVALGAVLGGAATAVVGSGSSAAGPSTGPSIVSTDDAAPTSVTPVLIARIFERVQTSRDVPVAAMPEAFDPDSFRYLGSAGWTDADVDGVTDTPYYAARGPQGTVCLVVVQEDSGYLSTCAHEAAYPSAGLRLSWQAADLHPAQEDGSAGLVLDITVTWLNDATIETRGSSRPRISPPPEG
jgi:hypothetical protein